MTTIPPPPPPPEWGGAYGYGMPVPPRDHPRAVTALVLGVLSLVACTLLGPFALAIGRKTVKEIDAAPGVYTGRSMATAGWVTGLIATILLGVAVAALVAVVVLAGTSSG